MSEKACAPRLRWHRRAKRALAHSLRVRLVTMFLLLALVMTAFFLFGMQAALSVGWRDAAKPLVADYIDKLAGGAERLNGFVDLRADLEERGDVRLDLGVGPLGRGDGPVLEVD